MNVDQMITNIACSDLSDEYTYPIMAALKAAQAMRRENSIHIGDDNYEELSPAMTAWDASTKEDV